MQAIERVLEIEAAFGEKIQGLVPLELDGESLRLIIYLKDGTNLRVTEQHLRGQTLTVNRCRHGG